jgi:tetratricopeptide (TPR) repeat protein
MTTVHSPLRACVAAALVCPLLLAVGCAPPPSETDAETSAAAPAEEIPVTTASETARALYDEGQYLLDVGRNVKANEKFRAAVAEDPAFVRAHFNQANAALSFKEFQECLDNAAEHLDAVSEGERMMVEINRTFLSNDPQKGVALGEQLVEEYPGSARAAIVLAGMQANQNDNTGARASFERALELEPGSAAALFGIANNYVFGEPKDPAKAEEYAREFLAAYPDEAKGYELLGDIKRGQGDLEGASEAYGQAGEADPTLYLAHHKSGHVNSFLGNIEQARAAYDQAIEMAAPQNRSGSAVFRSFTHIHAGDVAAAVDELEGVADQVEAMGTPADQVKGAQVFALNSAATAALHSGDLDRAADVVSRRNELQMSIAEDVGTDDARRLQEANCHMWDGLVAAYRGDAEGAAGHAEKIAALVESDENPRKMEPAHWVLGMSALQGGDYAQAVDHLRQADHANNMFIRYQLARAEQGAGNAEEAKRLFAEVASFNFNSVGFALVRKDAAAQAEG